MDTGNGLLEKSSGGEGGHQQEGWGVVFPVRGAERFSGGSKIPPGGLTVEKGGGKRTRN